MAPSDRARLLRRAAGLLESRRDELATLEARNRFDNRDAGLSTPIAREVRHRSVGT
jgi:acyl-CoA reductase-like NAD-dependent aldehyde dehydrogenase